MQPYRCVILGCGPRAHWHARAYNLVTRGELVACCDRNKERRQRFADAFELTGYADAADMIRKERPDLIHVVTRPRTRVELMNLVHEYSVPACIVEKPIAYQVTDWRALVDLQARTRTKFGVSAQFRYHPDLARCRHALDSGALGALLFVDASAVGTIADQGVHVIDWAMALNGDVPIVRVFGTASGGGNLTHPVHPSPDTTVAQLLFANGVRGMWNLGHTAPRVLDDEAYYKHCRVAGYAESGRVLYEEFDRWEILSPDGFRSDRVADLDAWAEGNHIAQANLTTAMFDWLEDDQRPVGTNLQRSLQQWNAVLALYGSAVNREPVDVPFDPPDDLWEQLRLALTGG